MRRSVRHRAGGWTAVLVASLALSACGSDSNDAGGTVDEGGTIKVGTITPKTGDTAIYYEVTRGMLAWFDAANENGGVGGYKFDVSVNDDGGEPARAVTAARRLLTQDGVTAFVGLNGTPSNAAMLPFLSESDVPVVGPLFSNYAEIRKAGAENYFVLVPDYSWDAGLALQYDIEENDTERVGILYQNDALGIPGRDGGKAVADELGVDVVEEIAYDAGLSNFLPQMQRLKESGAEVVVLQGSQAATAAVLEAGERIDYQPRLIVPYFQAGETLTKLAGPQLEGADICMSSYLPSPTEEGEVRDAVVEALPDHPIEAMTLNGWTQAALFGRAVEIVAENGDEMSSENLMKAFEEIDGEQVGGAPQVTFAGGRTYGLDGARILCTDEAGEFEEVSDYEPYPSSVYPGE